MIDLDYKGLGEVVVTKSASCGKSEVSYTIFEIANFIERNYQIVLELKTSVSPQILEQYLQNSTNNLCFL